LVENSVAAAHTEHNKNNINRQTGVKTGTCVHVCEAYIANTTN